MAGKQADVWVSEGKGHPGKLQGAYRLSFALFAGFLAVCALFTVLEANDGPLIDLAVLLPLVLWGLYTGLRVCNAYAISNGVNAASGQDAWLLFFAGVLYVLLCLAPMSLDSAILDSPLYMLAVIPVLFFVLYACVTTGRKLAWLAGHEMGSRATILRSLQLLCFPVTSTYILQHTRKPKRPITDHP